MTIYQIVEIVLLVVFYGAYLIKMFLQKKEGIQTSQLGKGSVAKGIKSVKTFKVERFVSIMSYMIIIMMVISVSVDLYWLQNNMLRTVGLLVSASGCATFIVGMLTLNDSWRAGIPESDQTKLVIRDIYKISRNPAFLGFDLIYIGSTLTFFNPFICITSMLAIISLHLLIMEEEKFLEKRFGEDYLKYKTKVGRYILFI